MPPRLIKSFLGQALLACFVAIVVACSSGVQQSNQSPDPSSSNSQRVVSVPVQRETNSSSPSETDTRSMTSDPPSIPSAPLDSPSINNECPTNVDEVVASLGRSAPLDPLLSNRMLDSIERGKQALVQISTNQNCITQRQLLRQNLRQTWQTYITLAYQQAQIFANSHKIRCSSGCGLFSSSDDSSCQANCDDSYSSELDDASRDREIKIKEMQGFFESFE
jgi:hypothetical protein